MSRVFLSHSSRDSRQAAAVKQWLIEHEPGLAEEIFLDLDPHTGIRPGERWRQALQQANARCEAVICLLSKHWEASRECQTEFRYAENLGKTILVARLEPVPDTNITSEWQRCDLFPDHGPTTEVDIADGGEPVVLATDGSQRLLDALRGLGIGAEHFPWPPPGDPDRAPYRGWAPLEEVDAAVYFGRDSQIVQALDELRQMRSEGLERLFIIMGPSGVGKSSFLRAGLLPRLKRDDRHFLPMGVVRPERRVLTGDTGLARSMYAVRKDAGLPKPTIGDIKDAITDAEKVRASLIEAAASAHNRLMNIPASEPHPTLVLPVDQAEELFGVDAGEEAPMFLGLLNRLLTDTGGPALDMIVVLTIRSDRYDQLQIAPPLSALESHPFDRLKPMPQAQFTDVICGPARRAAESGSRFALSSELVDRLAEDSSRGADTLPLLALTLSRLHDDYADSAEPVTVDRYEAMGGMRRVVQNEIDMLLSANPADRAEQLDRLHDAFIPWLATVNSDTGQPMRRIARWADLPEDSHALLDAFVGRRLLVKNERDDHVVVEVALESLFEQWDELAHWLRAEATDLRDADALERAAAAWERSGRRDDWLFDGARLAGAETLSARAGFEGRLRTAREFLLASRRRTNRLLETERRAAHARSLRRRFRVLAVLLVIIVALAVVAVINGMRARRAEHDLRAVAEQLAAANLGSQSRAMLAGARPGGDRRAIQQMVAAETLAPGSDPDSLLDTLIDTRRLLRVITAPSDVYGADVSPDGRYIMAGAQDGLIRRWDLESGEPVGDPLAGDTGKAGAQYLRDGRWIASVRSDQTVRILDANTGAAVHVLTGQYDPDHVTSAAFSQGGELFATGNRDGTVQLWELATGKQMGEPIRAHNGWVSAVDFSPDGTRLVTGGADGAMRAWNVSTHQPADPPLPSHRGPVIDVDFSRDGRRIGSMSYLIGSDPSGAAKSADGALPSGGLQVRITDASSGRPIVDGLTELSYAGNDLALSSDGRRVAIGADDGKIHVFDADTGTAVGPALSGHTSAVNSVTYSDDGTRIISAGDNTIHVWAAEPDQGIGKRLPGLAFNGSLPAAVSPDGRVVATRDVNNQSDIALWRIDSGKLVRTISTGQLGAVSALAWRPDGQAIACADGTANTVRIWNAQTGEPGGPTVTGPTNATVGLFFSPDGHRLAVLVLDSDPWLWDISASPPRATVLRDEEDYVATAGFSADGHRLITVAPMHTSGEDGAVVDMTPSAVRVWDTDTGEPAGPPIIGRGGSPMDLAQREDESPVFAGAISPDGQRILVSTVQGLRLHDVATGQPVGEPWIGTSSANPAVGLSFSADGAYVVSVDIQTSALQFREVRTGRLVGHPMDRHTGVVMSVAFTADGNHIVSRGAGDGWMLWPGPNSWRDELCDKLTANMTRAEWDEWVSPIFKYRAPCPLLDVPE